MTIKNTDKTLQPPWGWLMTLDLSNCNNNILVDREKIMDFFPLLCKQIGMTPVGLPLVGAFGDAHLHGISGMQFIETSSIIIHCDDKIGNRAFIDIFSCKLFDFDIAANFCETYFEGKISRKNVLERGSKND